MIRELRSEGTTLLLTTQYLEEADQLADRIAVIDLGTVIAEGTSDELKDRIGGEVLELHVPDRRRDREAAGERSPGSAAASTTSTRRRARPRARGHRRDGACSSRRCAAWTTRGSGSPTSRCTSPTLDDVFLTLTGRRGRGGRRRPTAPTSEPRRRRRRARRRRVVSAVATRPRTPSTLAVRHSPTDSIVAQRNLITHRAGARPCSSSSSCSRSCSCCCSGSSTTTRSRTPRRVDYVAFLMPGIFVQNAIFGSTTTAIGLAEDLKKGLIDRFRSLPMARSAVLVGRTTSDLVKNLLLVMIVIGVGYLVGFSSRKGSCAALGVIVLVLARRLHVLVDLGERRASRSSRSRGAGGRLHAGLPDRVREHGLRPGRATWRTSSR